MSSLAHSELRLSAKHGARFVALALLDAATEACGRLAGNGAAGDETARDDEALHDFRVAVRRLRSWLRAFEDELADGLRGRDLRRLKRVARATNPGRDLEVQLEWLRRAAQGRLARARREGAAWMIEHLAAREADAARGVEAVVVTEFPKVRDALAESLESYVQPVRASRGLPTLATAIGDRLVSHSAALGAALAAVHTVQDEKRAHEARIEAKRLRYLMEPVAPHVAGARAFVVRLKKLQDGLGALHDTHVIAHEIRAVLEASATAEAHRLSAAALGAADPTDADAWTASVPQPAILALARHLRRDMERAFGGVQRDWLDGRYEPFGHAVAALGERLRAGTASSP